MTCILWKEISFVKNFTSQKLYAYNAETEGNMPKAKPKTFNDYTRQLCADRLNNGWSVKAILAGANVERRWFNYWLNGEVPGPDVHKVERIYKYLTGESLVESLRRS